MQASFQKLITGLQSLDYSILDVNSHRWHDDYNKFKAGIKDLEVMLTNVIQLGFDNASSLVGRVELLEVPHTCITRCPSPTCSNILYDGTMDVSSTQDQLAGTKCTQEGTFGACA